MKAIDLLLEEANSIKTKLNQISTALSPNMSIFWASRFADYHAGFSQEIEGYSKVVNIGLAKSLLEFELGQESYGVPYSGFDKNLWDWAQLNAYLSGSYMRTQQFLQLYSEGLIDVIKDMNGLRIEYLQPSGQEAVEHFDHIWINQFVLEKMDLESWQASKAVEQNILKSLTKIVRVDLESFIAYNVPYEIEEYLLNRAVLTGRVMDFNDLFPGSCKFGGYTFTELRGALVFFIRRALRHNFCCIALTQTNRNSDLRALLTLWSTKKDLQDELADEIDDNTFPEFFVNLITSTPGKSDYITKVAGAPTPLAISLGGSMLITPTSSALTTPFVYLARQLKQRYKKDYFNAVNQREAFFQDEMKLFFNQFRHFHVIKEGMQIRSPGLRTDIDFLVLDIESGSIGVFQLKWQDPFGDSVLEGRSKIKNLESSSHKWLKTIEDWIKINGLDELTKRLGGKCPSEFKPKEYKVFIVGRYFSSWSGHIKQAQNAAWINWFSMLKMIYKQPELIKQNLGTYYDAVKDYEVRKRATQITKKNIQENIGKLKILVPHSVFNEKVK